MSSELTKFYVGGLPGLEMAMRNTGEFIFIYGRLEKRKDLGDRVRGYDLFIWVHGELTRICLIRHVIS